ncbi:MAG: hypothetical protein CVT79_16355 [Alphaproteobacteria bacterium HGW-Alphaproteobacteria-18]|nr:MAG: hypothetical protein CVT79_16355 [Alphaproteobacteria bacterium HGW-Alphaproteobacteria-18]
MNGWSLGGMGAAIVLALIVLLLACFVAVWLESRSLTSPRGYHQPDPEGFVFSQTPKTEAGLDFEDIDFPAPNGETLRGWLVPAAQPTDLAIVTLHGAGGDRRSYFDQLGMLHDLGATVLMFDARENGLSDGRGRGIGLAVREAEDAVAAVAEMRARGFGRVAAYGCSLGGSAAIVAAARDPSIDGIIVEASLSSFEDFVADKANRRLGKLGLKATWATDLWGSAVISMSRWRMGLNAYVKPEDVIERIAPRPVLLIHGRRDPWVIEAHADALVKRSDPETEYWLIEDADHCDGYQVAGDEYRSRVEAFIARLEAAD